MRVSIQTAGRSKKLSTLDVKYARTQFNCETSSKQINPLRVDCTHYDAKDYTNVHTNDDMDYTRRTT